MRTTVSTFLGSLVAQDFRVHSEDCFSSWGVQVISTLTVMKWMRNINSMCGVSGRESKSQMPHNFKDYQRHVEVDRGDKSKLHSCSPATLLRDVVVINMNQNDPNDTMKGLQFVSKVSKVVNLIHNLVPLTHQFWDSVSWAILVCDVKNPSSWWWKFSKQVGKDLVTSTYANDVRDRIDLVSLKELRLSYQKKWALSSTMWNLEQFKLSNLRNHNPEKLE